MTMEAETTGIIISTAVATKALDVALAWVKAKFTKNPQPFITEQTASQAKWKSNDHSLENLFTRLAIVEQNVAGLQVASKIQGDTLSRMDTRLGNLCDCILSGKVKLK